MANQRKQPLLQLPPPTIQAGRSFEQSLALRRSIREFDDTQVRLAEISQLLWAAQGVTGHDGERTAPSAGALYPLELYLVVGTVENLPAGLYKHRAREASLLKIHDTDLRAELASAALEQEYIGQSSAVIVIAAVYNRTTAKYGQRGIRYVHMEVGNVSQNIYLQANSLGLATVLVGAFDDSRVKKILNLPSNEEPLAIMPLGRRA